MLGWNSAKLTKIKEISFIFYIDRNSLFLVSRFGWGFCVPWTSDSVAKWTRPVFLLSAFPHPQRLNENVSYNKVIIRWNGPDECLLTSSPGWVPTHHCPTYPSRSTEFRPWQCYHSGWMQGHCSGRWWLKF